MGRRATALDTNGTGRDRRDARPVSPPSPAGKPVSRLARMLAGLAGTATVIVIVGLAVAVFFNPLWIGFEQERAGVPTITGYTQVQVGAVTDSILADLFLGPSAFGVSIGGQPVLGAAERSHMVDVRTVLLPLVILAAFATAVLLAVVAANWRSAIVWRAIARGSGGLALVGIVVGVAVLFFFDAAFLLFHRLFFPQGNFSFDPRTERLTQLFPEQFWTETSIGIVVVGLAITLVATVAARRRAASLAGWATASLGESSALRRCLWSSPIPCLSASAKKRRRSEKSSRVIRHG